MWPDLKDKWLKRRKLSFLWSGCGSLSLFLCHTLDWSSQAHLNSRGKWEIDSIAWWKSGSVLKKTCRARNDAVPTFGKCPQQFISLSHAKHTHSFPLWQETWVAQRLRGCNHTVKLHLHKDQKSSYMIYSFRHVKSKYFEESKYLNEACRNVPVCYKYSI